MNKKFLIITCVGVLSLSTTGCIAILAGAGGTALWQAGKVVSEENVSMPKGVTATEAVFNAQKITMTDKVIKSDATQLRGEDQAGTKIAVDVISKGPKSVRIEIRVGIGEEGPARELLNAIKKRL